MTETLTHKLREEFKAYLYTEKQLKEVNERLQIAQDRPEWTIEAKQLDKVSDAFDKRLQDIVNAVCISYKINADEFLGRLEEYEATK